MMNLKDGFFDYDFEKPYWFLLLLLLPLLFWLIHRINREKQFGFKYTNTKDKQQTVSSFFVLVLRMFLYSVKILAFFIFVSILASPIKIDSGQPKPNQNGFGIDLIFVLDVSFSMQAMDLRPNRLESAKRVIDDFIQQRGNDRIGLVAYSGEAYSVCYKTTDHKLLRSQLARINGNDLIQGTAIGVGLGTGITQLRGDSTTSKAIILLTDGKNNVGDISPMEAADLAVNEGVRVYTIGVGTNGYAPIPDRGVFGSGIGYSLVEIDEEILNQISNLTGGKYFRATDSKSLRSVIMEIDKIEKKRLNKTQSIVPLSTDLAPFLNLILCLCIVIIIGDIFLFINYE
ncbi:VWA domain-containing protein [Crocinitomicaceae bacterium]|nr:VWA domain-containing protein [Crocinitomicaceae bacterium]